MRDADDEIREIKTEIIESRGLVIKTNNLTNSLAADIKSIAKRQASYERRFTLNSAIAYVLFATLSFVGLKLWSDVRINEIESEKGELGRQVKELRQDLEEETRRAQRREQAELKAAAFYDLIRKKEYTKVVEGYDDIRGEQLSKAEAEVFRDTEDRYRLQLSVNAFQSGLGLMRTGRYAEAAESFQESIRLKEGAAHVPAVKLNLARALWRLGRAGEAGILAQEVIDQNINRELQADAAWLLSECAEDQGNIDDARNALRLLLRRWPRSALVPDARKRLGELNVRVWKGKTKKKS
ncbi:MAG: tetratricopeptide repeat protein [Myxococcales bacterium]|nr:tetratricopeptide repeat protein [Myxococcales bacterium]